jgi:hypothetical protein
MKYRALTPAEVGRFCLAISVGSYVMAVVEFFYPSVPDGSGRWGRLHLFIYQEFGPLGRSAFWVLIGTILLVSYFQHRKKHSVQ